MKMPTNQVLAQLKHDLIGKDSHRGVTLTYSWMANQFGHFSLGFIPTFIAYIVLTKYYTPERSIMYATIGVAVAWTLFETYNFLGPLLKGMKKHVFKPNFKNIAFDTFTDLCFFYLGGIVLHLILHFTTPVLIILVGLVILVLLFSRYWYINKMFLQIAEFPYQLRLSQWIFSLADANKEAVLKFIADDSPKHLLIFGESGKGKTSLAVAAATELAIKDTACTYTTATKILDMFAQAELPLDEGSNKPWTWRTASCLVIDDLNPGSPIPEILSPVNFQGILRDKKQEIENLKALKNKKTIWVIGNKVNGNEWLNLIKEIGVPESNISVVAL